MPTLTVVAGPNGSGKSTLTSLTRSGFQDVPMLDPDAIAKKRSHSVVGGGSLIDAGREILVTAERLLLAHESFLVETTLSGNTYLRMMREAKVLGYNVILYFVGTASIEINLQRVLARVSEGGHDVPESDQRRRYPRSMANLRKAFELSDQAVLFDNSSAQGHIRLAIKDGDKVEVLRPLPDWAAFLRPN